MKKATLEILIAAPAIVKSVKDILSPKTFTTQLPFGQLTKRITGRYVRQSVAEASLTKRRTAAVRQTAMSKQYVKFVEWSMVILTQTIMTAAPK